MRILLAVWLCVVGCGGAMGTDDAAPDAVVPADAPVAAPERAPAGPEVAPGIAAGVPPPAPASTALFVPTCAPDAFPAARCASLPPEASRVTAATCAVDAAGELAWRVTVCGAAADGTCFVLSGSAPLGPRGIPPQVSFARAGSSTWTASEDVAVAPDADGYRVTFAIAPTRGVPGATGIAGRTTTPARGDLRLRDCGAPQR
jgi:hypothetical protein